MQESFGNFAPKSALPISAAAETDVVVEFARSGKTYAVRSGQTLLEAAEEHGIGIPSFCRQGQCGTCKTTCWEKGCEWTRKRDSIPIRERKALC